MEADGLIIVLCLVSPSQVLSAIEFLDRDSIDAVLDARPDLRDPLSASAASNDDDGVAPHQFFVIVESGGAHGEVSLQSIMSFSCIVSRQTSLSRVIISRMQHDNEKLERFLSTVMASGDVIDGAVAQDARQAVRADKTLLHFLCHVTRSKEGDAESVFACTRRRLSGRFVITSPWR